MMSQKSFEFEVEIFAQDATSEDIDQMTECVNDLRHEI